MEIKTLYEDLPLATNDVIVFGCSYGPDSMALFKSLLLLREEIALKLVCAHVNHGKRGESEAEKIALEKYCEQHQVIFEYMKIEHYGDDNFHNEARNIRYQFFEEIVHKYDANYLLTAHHGDDLMETILMRLVRGSTLEGYSGFKKKVKLDNYLLYRPFYEITKEEIIAFNKKNNVPFALDKSNDSNIYTRNRYRKVVLPFLKEEDKLVHEKFIKFSRHLEQASEFIHRQTEKTLKKVLIDGKINISLFLQQEPFLQQMVLAEILEEFYQDDLLLISEKHIHLLLALIHSKKANVRLSFPNDVFAIKSYDTFYLKRTTAIISRYEIELDKDVLLPNGHRLCLIEECSGNSNMITRLSSEDVVLPLHVRTRDYGDTISLKGGGHKKIKDIFIEKKISKEERDLYPVVVDSKDNIVFIPGLKKSKFDRTKEQFYDIILRYE